MKYYLFIGEPHRFVGPDYKDERDRDGVLLAAAHGRSPFPAGGIPVGSRVSAVKLNRVGTAEEALHG